VDSSLKYMLRRKDAGQLNGSDLRHAVYKGQLPLFQYADGLHRTDADERSSGEAV
jgi:hypothetical protein